MLSGNGTIDYDVETHSLDAHKISAVHQESTTRSSHGSTASTLHGSTVNHLPNLKQPHRNIFKRDATRDGINGQSDYG